ncbi:adenylate/guanylate cyclase domain-containing protein [Mariprofundus sp. EBB-1]|nr:adenylate/guanylate cyclase domain-containing protein [Mariprofundus sp. EBB-1]
MSGPPIGFITMRGMPDELLNYLTNIHIYQLSPAWAKLDEQCHSIVECGGDWSKYTDDISVHSGLVVEDAFLFLCGQSFEADFMLPQMELRENYFTNIHFIRIASTPWLLFLDVSEQTQQQQLQQQNANELSLVRDQQRRVLDRYVGGAVAERSIEGRLTFDAAGERRNISTMFIDLRSFTIFNQNYDPQHVMDVLNQYMEKMIPPILDEFGLVDKITGDGAMTVFGVLNDQNNPSESALRAALRIQREVLTMNDLRREQGDYIMEVGIGIGSGEAVLGIIGARDRRAFSVIGPHVNLAARLEGAARGGEILVDETTFHAVKSLINDYECVNTELKGIGVSSVYNLRYSRDI